MTIHNLIRHHEYLLSILEKSKAAKKRRSIHLLSADNCEDAGLKKQYLEKARLATIEANDWKKTYNEEIETPLILK